VLLVHMGTPTSWRGAPPMPSLGRLMNRFNWKIADVVTKYFFFGRHYNRLRKRIGLPLLKDILYTGWISEKLTLMAVSAQLAEKMPDWMDSIKVCGFLDIPLMAEQWTPPRDLLEFLKGGEPPVYLTFGSMTQLDIKKSTEIMTKAVLMSGRRAIIQSHWDGVDIKENSPNILRILKVPHHNIFPSCGLVVHHGGAGTTNSTLYCGVPSIVVAHSFDQPFWGGELKRIGIGGEVFDIRSVTPKKLAKEINRIYNSNEIRDKARLIGESARNENGVSQAVKLIEQTFGRPK